MLVLAFSADSKYHDRMADAGKGSYFYCIGKIRGFPKMHSKISLDNLDNMVTSLHIAKYLPPPSLSH